ncbi:FG-GAP and VCBS repeat-containing protein [Streptomyces sp. NPDC048290]|uniref:FG-GAP and VCBS repeat-containing protein n=1 Tax=Streptomyces sp. NPDC048290 TaxID=3155811 RepID=UPI0034425510
MRKRVLLLATALTSGLLTTALPAATAAAAPSRLAHDFNGDGYRDLAIGAWGADVGSVHAAGAVVVMYGTASGVSTTSKRAVFTQNSPNVPGTAETDDRFGYSLAAGDLNGDGYSDLVVGSQYESTSTKRGIGSLHVLWGSRTGLSGGALLPQPSGLTAWGGYGSDVAVADVDGDGKLDVTGTGQNNTHLYQGPFATSGKPRVHNPVAELGSTYEVIAGDLDGDRKAERVYPFGEDGDERGAIRYLTHAPFDGNSPESDYRVVDLPNADGDPGAIGDINGDGYGDLVLGDSGEPNGTAPGGHKGGQISVWYGSKNGPDPAQRPTVVHQDTAGVPGAGEAYDGFGAAVAVGDVNGDGFADVAVGVPGEDNGTVKDTGAVTVLFGSSTGLKATGAKSYTQNTTGVPGADERGDAFGLTVQLTDLTKDRKAELIIGSGYENANGGITVLRGTSTGVAASGGKSFTAAQVGLRGPATFGWEIAE